MCHWMAPIVVLNPLLLVRLRTHCNKSLLACGYGLNAFPLIIRNCLLNTIVSTATEAR